MKNIIRIAFLMMLGLAQMVLSVQAQSVVVDYSVIPINETDTTLGSNGGVQFLNPTNFLLDSVTILMGADSPGTLDFQVIKFDGAVGDTSGTVLGTLVDVPVGAAPFSVFPGDAVTVDVSSLNLLLVEDVVYGFVFNTAVSNGVHAGSSQNVNTDPIVGGVFNGDGAGNFSSSLGFEIPFVATGTTNLIVEIEISGPLVQLTGTDDLSLDGAFVRKIVRYDTGSSPVDDFFNPGQAINFFESFFADITITDRPNGASNFSGFFPNDVAQLRVRNRFPPQTENDTLETFSVDLSGELAGVTAQGASWTFNSQEFFAGEALSDLPVLMSDDVASFFAGDIEFGDPPNRLLYRIQPAEYAVTVFGDTDDDGVVDNDDNCTLVPNGPDAPDAGGLIQYDSNGDGFGNACDPDLNSDNVVDFGDLPAFQAAFFSDDGDLNWNPDADLNGDGVVDFGDLPTLQNLFFQTPGPSGLVP